MDIQQKLWLAALNGDAVEARQLIENGAKVNAATDLFKATALHRASLMGKAVAVDVLLKVGANVNQEDGDGLTALHMVANIGNRMIVQNLLRSGAFVDAKNRDGRTPLHVAALNGDFKTVQLLILEKAAIDVLDKQGHTPLNLAKMKITEKKDEGLTEAAEPLYRTVALLESEQKKAKDMEEEPNLLHDFGEEVEARFREYLLQGSEEYYEINLMFIGQAGVGKTTLTKGLLGELDPSVIPDSTNDNSSQILNQRIGTMIQLSLKDKPVQCSGRIPVESLEQPSLAPSYLDYGVKEAESTSLSYTTSSPSSIDEMKSLEMIEGNENKPSHDNFSEMHHLDKSSVEGSEMMGPTVKQDNTLDSFPNTMATIVSDISRDSATASFLSMDDNSPNNLPMPQSVSPSSTNVRSLVSRAKVPSSEERLERLVPITIWDFGGQEVFYTTHQTFLSSSCIYMMAFNLFEFWREFKSIKGSNSTLNTISFWVNSVITYAKHAVPGYPKIVLIGTHADCFPAEERGKTLWMIFQRLEQYFRRSLQRQYMVINPRHFIDARDAEGVPFDLLRQCVMETAESLPDWGLAIPHKWVVLENLLADLRSCGCKILSIDNLQTMLTDEFQFKRQEIQDFLAFQHSISKILYFKDHYLHENVILDPCWVIDALSSFITDERISDYDFSGKSVGWNNLRDRGQLTMDLIEDVWRDSNFYPFKDYLLSVLCRLDLITRSKNKNFFYVPGMVKDSCPEQIVNDVHSSTEVGLVSFKISFRNNFLPPAIYNRIIAAFLSMFENFSESSTQLFNNCAIFELSRSRWTVLYKQAHEIEVFTYISDRRGKAADMKSFHSVYNITLDCLKDILKIYSAFQNTSIKQSDLPFEVQCQGCRKPHCYISKRDFHDLDCFRCPLHGDHLCSVDTLEEIFESKEFKEEMSATSNKIDLQSCPCPAVKENVECFLDYVASKFAGSECVFLSAALGFSLTFIEKQRHEFSCQHELAFNVLYNWNNTHPLPQSINKLVQALGDIERRDIVEEMNNFTFQKFFDSAHLLDIPKSDERISDEDLVIVSKKVKHFKRLFRFLQISQRCVDESEGELKGSPQDYIALIIFSKWKESDEKPSRLRLCAALLYTGMKAVVDKLIEKWHSKL